MGPGTRREGNGTGHKHSGINGDAASTATRHKSRDNSETTDSMGRRSSSNERGSQKSRRSTRALVISADSRRPRRRRLKVEPLGQRLVLAVITGQVYEDADASLRVEPGEVQLSSRLAYIDSNDNASLDAGEAIAIADELGQFRFDDVEDGIHSVRLYSGAAGQRQTFPADPVQSFHASVPQGTLDIGLIGQSLYVLSSDTLAVSDPFESSSQGQPLPFQATSLTPIGGQTPAAFVNSQAGDTWLVRPDFQRAVQVGAQDGFDVRAVSVGNDGYGVALVAQGGALRVMALGGLENDSLDLATTSAMVPSNAQVIGDEAGEPLSVGSRTIFAWSEPSTTTRLSIWSNSAAQWVQDSSASLTDFDQLLSFDDQAGLLAIRYVDGSVGVLDVDAGFAPLHKFNVDGPTKLLPGLDAIASIASTESGYEFAINDLRTGSVLTKGELDAAQIGTPKTIVGNSYDSLYVLGDFAVASIRLDQAAAHVVEVNEETPVVDIAFGAQITGTNYPPNAALVMPAHGTEDQTLEITPQDLERFVSDVEGDHLIPIVVDAPTHGEVAFDAAGGIHYTPEPNYFGDDLFAVVFFDGVNVSSKMHFDISLASVPDSPDGLTVDGLELPELSEPGYVIGTIEVQDVDNDNLYQFSVSDPRFEVADGKLVYRGGTINFEGEPRIELTVSGYDQAAGHQFHEDLVVAVTDQNDPIVAFVNDRGEVVENAPGEIVAELSVIDEDLPNQVITYTVDDPRFEVIGDELRLKSTESLNYEVEPIVLMTVTANDGAGSSFSIDFQVSVLDVINEGGDIDLSKKTVMEWEPGATVGQISVDPGATSGYELTVDDSRFEIDGTTLKLIDETWVRYDEATQIQLTVTASSSESGMFSETFVVQVLENDTPFHNDDQPYDVDDNGSVSPGDALDIINYLNTYGPGSIGPGHPGYGYDVNGDGVITTIDALLVINYLNRVSSGGSVDGEGKSGNASESDSEVSTSEDTDGGLGTSSDGEGEQAGGGSANTGGWVIDQDDEDKGSEDSWDLNGDEFFTGI